ncbi:hypothetical protein Y1Q_0012638 [Alligator mississippiensis]|uniref:Uncharacterized protein n=1 Tax=Alligator mississippiensis TaxID=8496 RepID=A0A151M8E0_ALLMI|nr:hypothetical protein Y1Q_0012638 [Alligator mississippiensis]
MMISDNDYSGLDFQLSFPFAGSLAVQSHPESSGIHTSSSAFFPPQFHSHRTSSLSPCPVGSGALPSEGPWPSSLIQRHLRSTPPLQISSSRCKKSSILFQIKEWLELVQLPLITEIVV